MDSIVGIFNSFADAKCASAILRTLGIPDNRITALSPHTTDAELEAQIPTTETEQPGMGAALGGTVGAALGTAGGLEAGAAAASFLIPGVGPILALGLIGAAISMWMRQSIVWASKPRCIQNVAVKHAMTRRHT